MASQPAAYRHAEGDAGDSLNLQFVAAFSLGAYLQPVAVHVAHDSRDDVLPILAGSTLGRGKPRFCAGQLAPAGSAARLCTARSALHRPCWYLFPEHGMAADAERDHHYSQLICWIQPHTVSVSSLIRALRALIRSQKNQNTRDCDDQSRSSSSGPSGLFEGTRSVVAGDVLRAHFVTLGSILFEVYYSFSV